MTRHISVHVAILTLALAGCVASSTSNTDDGGVEGSGGASGAGPQNSGGGSAATGGASGGYAGVGGVGGVAGVATGGSSGSGGKGGSSGGATGGGAGASGDSSVPVTGVSINAGGFVVGGNWHGYAWTTAVGAGTTITPADFSAITAGGPLCVSGSVGPAADFGGMAALGINLNQAELEPNPPAAITPTGDGLVVGLQNKIGTALRVQIQGPNGSTDPTDRWCAPLSGSGGLVPWSAFNTKCWDNTGTAYAKQPLQSAMILVPGGDKQPVAFNFCVTGILPSDVALADGGPTITPDPGQVTRTGTGSTCQQYGRVSVTRNNVPYIVVNNAWGGADETQCIDVNGTAFTVTRQNGTGNTSGAPVSYPSVIYGRKDASDISASSALPAPLSQLSSVRTGISTNADGLVPGVYNASYDVWLNADANPSDAPTGAYLMVWLYQPATARPAGSLKTTVTLGNVPFNVWYGGTGANGRPYIAYVAQKATTNLTFELVDFIKDAIGRGVVQSGWYLTNVQAGFEIWSGGMGLQMRDFWVDAKK